MANGSRVEIVDVVPEYAENLARILAEGISYPKSVGVSKFNSMPSDGEEFLKNIGGLYQAMLKLRTVAREFVRPTERKSDLVLRLPDRNFGEMTWQNATLVTSMTAQLLRVCSLEAAPELGSPQSKARLEAISLRPVPAKAASIQLAFLVGPEARQSAAVRNTISTLLSLLTIDKAAVEEKYRRIYERTYGLLDLCKSLELFSEELESILPKIMLKKDRDSMRLLELARGSAASKSIRMTAFITGHTDSSRKIALSTENDRVIYGYFLTAQKPLYDAAARIPPDTEVEVEGVLTKRDKIDRIDINSIRPV